MRYLTQLIIICVIFALSGCQSRVTLVTSQQSDYQIVVAPSATSAEQFAARELQHFIHEMTGLELPLVSAAQNRPSIFVGTQAHFKPGWAADSLAEEEFWLHTEAQNIYVLGGTARGTLYGVYTLLRDYWGCRWYTPEISKIPQTHVLELPALNLRQTPAFEYRETYFPAAIDTLWVLRNRLNRTMRGIPDSLGGQYGIFPFVHTFYNLVPPKTYFAEHPEYFSMINGQRQEDRAQLCLTNPEVLKIATQQVFQWIEEHPDLRIVTVDQNDGEGWCECPQCQAVVDDEGSQSAPILKFVNAIAAEVAQNFPQVSVQTLAYHYSEVPPKTVKPGPNVIIRLCRYANFCDGHPIEGCRVNRNFVKILNGWHEISPKIMVWDYLVDFAHFLLPFPNFDGIKQDLRFYKEHGVAGLFEQGSYPRKGSEWADLRAWVLAQLLWNPNQNADELFDEFLTEVYGPAEPFLAQYIQLLHQKVRQDSIHFNMYASPQVGYLTPQIVAQSEELLQQAEAAVANDSVRLPRVELAHVPILYTRLYFYSVGGKAYLNDSEMPAVADKFLRICQANGIGPMAESDSRGNVYQFIQEVKKNRGDFWTSWWLLGPFANLDETGLQTEYPPETEFDTTKTYTGLDGDALNWQAYENPASGYINFKHIFKKSEMGVAYACREFTAKFDTTLTFGFGSNDGIRVWLNGEMILDHPAKRLAVPNQEVVKARVQKGKNRLLLKIDQFGGGWGFYCAVLGGA